MCVFVCMLVSLTSSLWGPYLASCRARADLKGVGVQGDDSRIERRTSGVLNLRAGESERERESGELSHVLSQLLCICVKR